jgi:hypothetical protein
MQWRACIKETAFGHASGLYPFTTTGAVGQTFYYTLQQRLEEHKGELKV